MFGSFIDGSREIHNGNGIERQGVKWSGVEPVILLFGSSISLTREKKGNARHSHLDPPI